MNNSGFWTRMMRVLRHCDHTVAVVPERSDKATERHGVEAAEPCCDGVMRVRDASQEQRHVIKPRKTQNREALGVTVPGRCALFLHRELVHPRDLPRCSLKVACLRIRLVFAVQFFV